MAFSTLTRKFLFREGKEMFVSVFSYFSPRGKKSNDFGEPMAGIDLIIRTYLNLLQRHGHLFRQERS